LIQVLKEFRTINHTDTEALKIALRGKNIDRETDIENAFSREYIFTYFRQYKLENSLLVFYFLLVNEYYSSILCVMEPFPFPYCMAFYFRCLFVWLFLDWLQNIFIFYKLLIDYYETLFVKLSYHLKLRIQLIRYFILLRRFNYLWGVFRNNCLANFINLGLVCLLLLWTQSLNLNKIWFFFSKIYCFITFACLISFQLYFLSLNSFPANSKFLSFFIFFFFVNIPINIKHVRLKLILRLLFGD